MAAMFEALARRSRLHVVFCSRTGTRGAGWVFPEGLPFPHTFVEGLTIRRTTVDATDYHLSPRIFAEIARHRPQAVITAGFSMPSAYALAYTALTGAGLVVHSDGTSASEADFSAAQMFARRVLLTARPV